VHPVWAGEGIDLITDLPSAADLVGLLATQTEHALAEPGRRERLGSGATKPSHNVCHGIADCLTGRHPTATRRG
jgi:hypothetical protein